MDTNDFSASLPENMLHIIPGEKQNTVDRHKANLKIP